MVHELELGQIRESERTLYIQFKEQGRLVPPFLLQKSFSLCLSLEYEDGRLHGRNRLPPAPPPPPNGRRSTSGIASVAVASDSNAVRLRWRDRPAVPVSPLRVVAAERPGVERASSLLHRPLLRPQVRLRQLPLLPTARASHAWIPDQQHQASLPAFRLRSGRRQLHKERGG